MPQLSLLREPTASILSFGIGMPRPNEGRWHLSAMMQDYDGRPCGDSLWAISKSAEHADIGLVLKEGYDAWFNGDWWQVPEAIDRAIRRRL